MSRSDRSNPSRPGRRRFLAQAGGVALGLPIAIRLIGGSNASAAELPPLPLDNPQAQALGDYQTGEAVDKQKYPEFKPERNCANCQLLQGADTEAYRPYQLFRA